MGQLSLSTAATATEAIHFRVPTHHYRDSEKWKWMPLSRVLLFVIPWTEFHVGSLSLFQEIFPTQESNPGLWHCRQILYQILCQQILYQADSLPATREATREARGGKISLIKGETRKGINLEFGIDIYTSLHLK